MGIPAQFFGILAAAAFTSAVLAFCFLIKARMKKAARHSQKLQMPAPDAQKKGRDLQHDD